LLFLNLKRSIWESETPSGKPRDICFSSPLMGEDQGGGKDMAMLPPPLTPPTRGGEFKGCHHVVSKPLAKTDHPLGKPRGILAYVGKGFGK
jgi:hypothetical protein